MLESKKAQSTTETELAHLKNQLELLQRENEQLKAGNKKIFIDIILAALDEEYLRVVRSSLINENQAARKTIVWLASEYVSTNFSTFFVLAVLEKLTNSIYSDVDIREFVMNVTERACISLASLYDGKGIEMFREMTLKAVLANKPSPTDSYSLVSTEITQTIHIEKDDLDKVLKDNIWLNVIYIALQNLHDSIAFENFNKGISS